jgi:hypothetical protein
MLPARMGVDLYTFSGGKGYAGRNVPVFSKAARISSKPRWPTHRHGKEPYAGR